WNAVCKQPATIDCAGNAMGPRSAPAKQSQTSGIGHASWKSRPSAVQNGQCEHGDEQEVQPRHYQSRKSNENSLGLQHLFLYPRMVSSRRNAWPTTHVVDP